MNEIVISRIPMPSVEEQIKLIQTEKNHHNTPQTPPLTTQPSNYVSRETSPNTQPTTTQKPYSEAHAKGSTASKSSKSSHTSKLIQPLEESIHANRRQTGKNTSSVLLFLTSKK
jgi:hypothetical protein